MDDFDLLRGSGDVADRRLTPPLGSGTAGWVEFPGDAASDSRTGRLDPPVVGGFTSDRRDFHGEDTYDGRTWEPNWNVDLTRAGRAGT
ncbi:hypothetical protein [Streptomyces formicae]|uniref:Uncharacterized protein n=1 Tax=Streptomyces formicae TaxID=1616117 RepID=A0ABY3WMW7_9ACTN|nr:hypothetical protein [Streptomyces formicae]UNM12652.1 hypothetical protein J4032_14980 [Streptomyces formicae]